MCFLGSKFTQNALAARAPPRTPQIWGELKRSPRSLAISGGRFAAGEGQRRGKREEGKGKRDIGEEKEGGNGREEGREGKGKEEGKGGEEVFVSLALGGIDAPG